MPARWHRGARYGHTPTVETYSTRPPRERSLLAGAVAAEVRAERARHRLTQAQVAEAAGIPDRTYVRLDTGERVMDVAQLARVCDALGILPSQILARAEDEVARVAGPTVPQQMPHKGVIARTPRTGK